VHAFDASTVNDGEILDVQCHMSVAARQSGSKHYSPLLKPKAGRQQGHCARDEEALFICTVTYKLLLLGMNVIK